MSEMDFVKTLLEANEANKREILVYLAGQDRRIERRFTEIDRHNTRIENRMTDLEKATNHKVDKLTELVAQKMDKNELLTSFVFRLLDNKLVRWGLGVAITAGLGYFGFERFS